MRILTPPLPRSARVNAAGHLEVAGCDVVELAAEFGTPLFIYDEQEIRDRCREYRQAFATRAEGARIIYASKAFTCLALLTLMAEEGMSLDVASGGELFAALSAWFPPEDIFLHGNANTRDELHWAVRNEIGHVVLDSLDELRKLDAIAGEVGRVQPVLLRITPGIEAHTHDYVQTGKQDSKFGFSLSEDAAFEAVKAAMDAPNLALAGLHCHIGSQIFSMEPYRKAAAVMANFMAACRGRLGFECRLLDMGGGLGAAYTPEDEPAPVGEYAEAIAGAVTAETARAGVALPQLAVEPGRSIVANAGLTAYEIETVKSVPGVRRYAAVDGGMSDNLRPALYGAGYMALIASRPEAAATETVTVAGKHCESGDILVRDAALPDPAPGDILVTPATGAYGYSMASNYNGQPRPAVIFAKDGSARVVIRRETYEDLIRLHKRAE